MIRRGQPRRLTEQAAAAELAQRGDEIVVVDVRTPAEQARGHLAGAQLIDAQAPDFRDRIAPLDRHATYFLYCRSGNRSGHAARIMADMGFADPVNVGGYAGLVDAGAPAADARSRP